MLEMFHMGLFTYIIFLKHLYTYDKYLLYAYTYILFKVSMHLMFELLLLVHIK